MATNKMCDRLLIVIAGGSMTIELPAYLVAIQHDFAEEIRVVMTLAATRLLSCHAVDLLLSQPVYTQDRSTTDDFEALSKWAQILAVLPDQEELLAKRLQHDEEDLPQALISRASYPLVFFPCTYRRDWQSSSRIADVERARSEKLFVFKPREIDEDWFGDPSEMLMPSVPSVVNYLQHAYLLALRKDYWDVATATKPLTPAQRLLARKAQALGSPIAFKSSYVGNPPNGEG